MGYSNFYSLSGYCIRRGFVVKGVLGSIVDKNWNEKYYWGLKN